MPIEKSEIKDYKSSYGDSEGGSISTVQIATTELAVNVSAGSNTIQVYDGAPFSVGDEIIIDDKTNKEKKTIVAINGNTFTLDSALSFGYSLNTPVSKKNNLFPDITAQEAMTGVIKYKKFFKKNTNSSITWEQVKCWIDKQPTNAAISIGLGINDTNDNDYNQGNMSALTSNSQIALVSDGSDTRQVTLKGVNANGILVTETITLNGPNEVLSTNTFSKLYLAYVSALDSNRTITIKQGSGGATRGTIGPNKICCWLWFGKRYVGGSLQNAEGGDIPDEDNSMLLGNLSPNGVFGFWVRLQVPAGAGAVSGNDFIFQFKGQSA